MSCLFAPLWWISQALCLSSSTPPQPPFMLFWGSSWVAEGGSSDPFQETSQNTAFDQKKAYSFRTPQLNLLFVGDVLLHQPQHQQALRHPQGHQSLWSSLLFDIQQADIAYANLEGPIAPGLLSTGKEVADPGCVFDKRVYSSYPLFNYHDFLADDLKDSGFDVVSTANNHALDRSGQGVDKTIEQLERVGLGFSGTRPQGQNRSWATRVIAQGWTVSFIACTEHTNGMPDPHRQVLKCNEEALKVIEQEKEDATVDVVVVTPHWGEEYQPHPHSGQKNLARKMIQSGADVIVGSHPHVVQTVEWIENVPVVYSLGNFVSNQFHRQATQEELMVKITVHDVSVPSSTHSKPSFRMDLEAVPLKMTRTDGYQVRKKSTL